MFSIIEHEQSFITFSPGKPLVCSLPLLNGSFTSGLYLFFLNLRHDLYKVRNNKVRTPSEQLIRSQPTVILYTEYTEKKRIS